ncbi:MAG: ligase-associated DNA damage response DEXH box helicase [Candidatus Sumerlaeaceae bacterium]
MTSGRRSPPKPARRRPRPIADPSLPLAPQLQWWFRKKRWSPFTYQFEAWRAYLDGRSGLVNAPTGMGKTYSVWMGPLSEWLFANPDESQWKPKQPAPPTLLWITPLRALSNDTASALRAPLTALGIPWTLELRTGDTSAAIKARQRERLPTVLITTPESLSVLLSYEDTHEKLTQLKCVVVDEWHELLGSKRGTQTELALARLRNWVAGLRTWGLSATLGNLPQALDVLLGGRATGQLIRGPMEKQMEIETLLPDTIERFPWSGHIGLRLLPQVIESIARAKSTLVFTNTRAQAELWYQSILAQKPKWANQIALHHGSLDREIREAVEQRLREARIKAVVCTSSLDLGVDFPDVDQVMQIGSPKGVARLLQRAGRSGHQPGGLSRILCVPTHALEFVEYAAARDAALAGELEPRDPLNRPLDVLVQHLVTLALGGGYEEEELYEEVRTAYAFRELTRTEWDWCLEFVTRGGPALRNYPQFQKLVKHHDRYGVASPLIARLHRLNIGTITGDLVITVKLQGGNVLGTVEENFIAKLHPGDRFVFAGRVLELVRFREATAVVKFADSVTGMLPSWGGSRMPITSELGRAVRYKLADAREGRYIGPEMQMVKPILEVQREWSVIPRADEVLIETTRTREGFNVYIYPFEGRFVHEGIGALVAYRIAKDEPSSVGVTMNDYGFEMLCARSIELDEAGWKRQFSQEHLLDDLVACLNAAELARRQFREIARVAGLIFGGYPGAPKTGRQIHASSSLIYDVFRRYDPQNLLLDQANREVLEKQLEVQRLRETLARLESSKLVIVRTRRFTPLAFPLWATRIGSASAYVSTERFGDRIKRMALELEEAYLDEQDQN